MFERICSHVRGNVVAYLALFLALAGTAMASGVFNKKKVNRIISNRAPGLSVAQAKSADTAKSAENASSADNAKNADKLGGVAPSGYQGFCKAGGIKATLVVDTNGFNSSTFQNVAGFNCFEPGNTTSSVQMKRLGTGDYQVRFVGNKGPDASGSAVCSLFIVQNLTVTCTSEPGGVDAPGETVFDVAVLDPGAGFVDGEKFSLLAF